MHKDIKVVYSCFKKMFILSHTMQHFSNIDSHWNSIPYVSRKITQQCSRKLNFYQNKNQKNKSIIIYHVKMLNFQTLFFFLWPYKMFFWWDWMFENIFMLHCIIKCPMSKNNLIRLIQGFCVKAVMKESQNSN